MSGVSDSLYKLTERIDPNKKSYKISRIEQFPNAVMVQVENSWGVSSSISGYGKKLSFNFETVGQLISGADFLNTTHRSILIASLNAITNSEKVGEEIKAHHYIQNKFSGKNVAVIGRFPFSKRNDFSKSFNHLYVFDLFPQEGEFSPSDYEKILPHVDVVMMTAQTLVNGTFDKVLSHVDDKTTVCLIGPSTPLDLKLHSKINIFSGAKISDPNRLINSLKAGRAFKQSEGLTFVTLLND